MTRSFRKYHGEEKELEEDAGMSKNTQFRAIQASTSILSYVEDNVIQASTSILSYVEDNVICIKKASDVLFTSFPEQ